MLTTFFFHFGIKSTNKEHGGDLQDKLFEFLVVSIKSQI